MLDQKIAHMKIGAEKIRVLLNNPVFGYLSSEQKQRIVHLVSIHDSLEELKDRDEFVLMEADSLAVADSGAVRPTHSKEDYLTWLDYYETYRVPKFITDYSKEKVKTLLAHRAQWYLEHEN